MKKFQLIIWLVIGIGTLGFSQINRNGTRTELDLLKKSEAGRKINRVPLKSTCGDLSAKAIEYQLIKRSTDRSGLIKVTGTVKNIAKFPFRVKEGKVKIKLIEVTGEKRRIVKGVKLTQLKEGKQVKLEYTKRWFAKSKSPKRPVYYLLEIEYPSSKTLQLTHNDCKMSNNIGRRETQSIDLLFSKK